MNLLRLIVAVETEQDLGIVVRPHTVFCVVVRWWSLNAADYPTLSDHG